jgi:hypothetical protein
VPRAAIARCADETPKKALRRPAIPMGASIGSPDALRTRCIMAKRKANRSQFTLTSDIPSLSSFQRLLERTNPQACSELVEGALSQLEFGLADMTLLHGSLSNCELYSALLRRGYRLVSRAMSPGEITEALNQVAAAGLAAGWIAHESGVQSALLTELFAVSSTPLTGPEGRRLRKTAEEE